MFFLKKNRPNVIFDAESECDDIVFKYEIFLVGLFFRKKFFSIFFEKIDQT
jgi:hypothetical protein